MTLGDSHLNDLHAHEREVENDGECHPRSLQSLFADICLQFKVVHFICTFPELD